MHITPFENAENLRIGTVFHVAPDRILVHLEREAPRSVAMNAQIPRPFPRVNGYLLIPMEKGFVVGQIEWIEVVDFPTSRTQAFSPDFIRLPESNRRLSLSPLGILFKDKSGFKFRRGTEVLPLVGDPVLLPTTEQLQSIVRNSDKEILWIGTSPLAYDAKVYVDPDRMFGRHLAVLGNTGSGKSCTVAGLIQWSLEASRRAAEQAGNSPNARFVILDPNGEYAKAFNNHTDVSIIKIFSVNAESGGEALKIPIWFMNVDEWAAFTKATERTQKPVLIQALQLAREGIQIDNTETSRRKVRNFLGSLLGILRIMMKRGTPWGGYGQALGVRESFDKWAQSINWFLFNLDLNETDRSSLVELLNELNRLRGNRQNNEDLRFNIGDIENLRRILSTTFQSFGGEISDLESADADRPVPFALDVFIHLIEASAEIQNAFEHIEPYLLRVRSLFSDVRLKPFLTGFSSEDVTSITLHEWLEQYIGETSRVTIIDLSLIPSTIIHIVTAVIARMIFEALQRYRKRHGSPLPTVLVMEEAHTFVRRYRENTDQGSASIVCTQIFEKIAREGRKFGLTLVISSQRPAELSPTVLSQCNTYILHRITNDRDQEQVKRFVPDNLRGLLRELPGLPTQHAILVGWAAEIPILLRIRDLDPDHMPQSNDPDFWKVWSGETERHVNWQEIAYEWQNPHAEFNTNEDQGNTGDV